jgi:hypothetical protein
MTYSEAFDIQKTLNFSKIVDLAGGMCLILTYWVTGHLAIEGQEMAPAIFSHFPKRRVKG